MGRLLKTARPLRIVMVFALLVSVTGCSQGEAPPSNTEPRPSSSASASASAGDSDPPSDRTLVPDLLPTQIQPTFGPGDQLKALPWRDQPTSWDPVNSVALSTDPIDRAVVATEEGDSGGPARIHLLGLDGRWRYVDLPSNGDEAGWLSRGSLSREGLRLALRSPQEVRVMEVATGQFRTFAVDTQRLGGNEVFWGGGDRRTLFLGSGVGGFGYADRGYKLNVDAGKSHRLPYDPSRAAYLPGGDALVNPFDYKDDSLPAWQRLDESGRFLEERTSEREVGYLTHPIGARNRAAFANQTMLDPRDGRKLYGVSVVDARGRPIAMLPVKRWDLNGGGGGLIGWLDQGTVLFRVVLPNFSAHAVAWQIDSGRLIQVADFAGKISVAVDNL